MSRRLLTLAVFVCGTLPALLQAQQQSSSLEEFRVDFLKVELEATITRLREPREALDDLYRKQLTRLEKTVAGAGNLEQALAVETELDGFAEGNSPEASGDFPALRQLQRVYRRERTLRERALQEKLVLTYQEHLKKVEALQDKLTRLRQLELAVKAREEKARVATLLKELNRSRTSDPGSSNTYSLSGRHLERKEGRLHVLADPGHPWQKNIDAVEKLRRIRNFVFVDVASYANWIAIRADGTVESNRGQQFGEKRKRVMELTCQNSGPGAILYQDGTVDLDHLTFEIPESFRRELVDIIDLDHAGVTIAALKSDGTVRVGGTRVGPAFLEEMPPDALQNVQQIALGDWNDLFVLKENGRVETWRIFPNTEVYRPVSHTEDLEAIIEIDGAPGYVLARDASGRVFARGMSASGVLNVPPDLGPCTKIRAEPSVCAARREDGKWFAWGNNSKGIVDRINQLETRNAIDMTFTAGSDYLFWIE